MLDAAERQKHLDMIRTPDNWPCWPILPLKRWGDWTKELNGLLLAHAATYNPRGQIWVIHFNMYQMPTIEKNGHSYLDMAAIIAGPHTVCFDAEAVLDAGWKVD